jgi:enamidase
MFRIVLAASVLVLLASPAAMAGQADVILLGGKIITSETKQTTAEAIALARERILGVGPTTEIRRLAGPSTRIVDLHGRTVIPGLIDAHVHLSMREVVDEQSFRDYERTALPPIMTGFLRHGITTVRSTGDALPYVAELRDRLERGEVVGPRLRITGPSLTAPGGHPATTVCRSDPVCRRLATRELDGEAHAREVVQEVVRAKVDAIKVVVDDTVVNTPPLSDAVVAALVAEAHRAGARVIAHVAVRDEIATAKRLIDVGVDEFAHPPAEGGDTSGSVGLSELAAILAKRAIPVTSTLSRADAFRDATGAERTFNGNPYSAARRQQLERRLNAVRSFSEAGVKLLVGTDWSRSPVDDDRLLPGAMTLHELEVLHRAGLSTSAILTAATRNAAEALGIIDHVGTIAVGKVADLVILDGDLIQDFSALYRTVAVLKGGRIVYGALPAP